MLQSAAGRLLVATPLLTDPNFARAVLFICFHDANGAFGLVLNRPVEAQAADLVPEWRTSISTPGHLYSGGPVERSSLVGLGRIAADGGGEPEWWTGLGLGVGLVNLGEPQADAGRLEALRVFHGYAGWGAGQLDAELGEDAWFVLDARRGDPFVEDASTMWRDVLLRQRGEPALYGRYPEDPRLN